MISTYFQKKVVHVTLDSGATVSFITTAEASRLGMKIQKASQLANQADGETKMHVVGEVHEAFTRGAITFTFNALVVKKLNDATILAGMNFLFENEVSQEPYKHRITVKDKYYIEETPSQFIYPKDAPISQTVNIKRVAVLHPNEFYEINLPKHYPSNTKFVVDSSDQANSDQTWLSQEVHAVNRSLKIKNETSKPIILGKNQDTSVIKIRPVISSSDKISKIDIKYKNDNSNNEDFIKSECTLEYVQRINAKHKTYQPPPEDLFIPSKVDPEEYLKKIYVEPGVMDEKQQKKLWAILRKYHKVFDKDISEGYNNASGEFDVDWNWLNDQQPPPGVSKQEVYANEEMNQLKQSKIDWMESQNICFKAHLLGVPVKYASLTMLVPKATLKDHKGPLSHDLFRFVNLFNQLNDYIKLEPSQPESISSVLYEAGQWQYMISGDLTNSFYQRWITKKKLPYMAFHSPYKGMYILARSAQGMKNQSEGLDQMLRVILGDLIKQGKARKIADDVQAGGQTVDEAIDNLEKVLIEFDKNNIKMDPRKTRIFAKKLPIFGWIKENQSIKPDQHRILAIEKSAQPKTITELRSYLGSYKVFYRHMPNMSVILNDLQQLAGEKNGKMEIVWTESLENAFKKSKEALENIKPLYLPERSDQLAITLDWSERGIGATLWALLKAEKKVVCYFSAPLKGAQSRWPPCDGEGLAACAAIERFSGYIREASLPTLICSDNKPVVQAALLLSKGYFSSSPRLNKLLGNCNTFPISFHHLSGKLALNEESDLLSRNPSQCKEVDCPVCEHLTEQSEVLDSPMTGTRKHVNKFRHISVKDTFVVPNCHAECHSCKYLKEADLNPELTIQQNLRVVNLNNLQVEDILKGDKPFPYLKDRKNLIQVQRKDPVLAKLILNLQSGNRPTARNTKCIDLKTYLSFQPKLDYDGLVVIERVLQPHLISLQVPIIPPNFARSILLAAHLKLGHPKPSQLEKMVFRSFCTLKVKNMIKDLFENCFTCQADLIIPKEAPNFKTESKPKCPGVYWTCDVMKHGKKNIMVCTDNFSSFTTCAFIDSEKQNDCENAIISSIFPFKAAMGDVKVRVDTAPGLSAMVNHSSDDFKEAGVLLEPGDIKNKNSLSKVDKTMAELRAIFRTISTDGSPLSPLNLQKAVQILNMRIRHSNLSAREIMFSRLQDSNKNILINDEEMAEDQFERRVKANETAAKNFKAIKKKSRQNFPVHSLVFLKQDVSKDKSKVRDLYIVMEVDDEKAELKVQKMLNPLTNLKNKVNERKLYKVRNDDVYLAPSQSRSPQKKSFQKIIIQNDSLKNKFSSPSLVPTTSQLKNKFYFLDDDGDDIICEVKDPLRHENNSKNASYAPQNQSVATETTNSVLDKHIDLSIWSTAEKQQSSRSPIIQTLHNPEFGRISMSWDHSSDLSIPLYEEEWQSSTSHQDSLVKSVIESILDDDYEDDVFEDDTVNQQSPEPHDVLNEGLVEPEPDRNRPVPGLPLNLHLIGDKVQPGRVYRLESRLPVPLDLHLRENQLVPGKVYKLKRLRNKSKEVTKEKNKNKKKRSPVIDWFIKKITFSKKRPPDKDDEDDESKEPVEGVLEGEQRGRRGAASN